MTIDQFRACCLKIAGAVEGGHMEHPDFRVGGRIFATLGYPNAACGMVKVSPEEQAVLVASEPDVYAPASGAWGRGGSTIVQLTAAKRASIAHALELAADLALSMGPVRSAKKSAVKKKSAKKRTS